MGNSYLLLPLSLCVAVGSWGYGLTTWEEALQVNKVCSLIGIFGGIALAWMGQSPIKPKE